MLHASIRTSAQELSRALTLASWGSAAKAFGIVLLVGIAVAGAIVQWRRPPGMHDIAAASECRRNYGRARNSSDSAFVDGQRPITSRGFATTALTCREIRLMRGL